MKKNDQTLLGAHVSVAGGLANAFDQAQALECNVVQFFTHSSRQWLFNPLDKKVVADFIKAQQDGSVQTVVHASYLMNPASPEASVRKKSEDLLIRELQACHELKVPYLVLHPGARLNSDLTQGLAHCSETINRTLDQDNGKTKIALENMAGQGTVIASKLEELAEIYEKIEQKERVGFCFDTCHAFSAGYDFTTQAAYETFWQEFDKILSIKKLYVIHINDSLKKINSHIDRHASIGLGSIGIEAFNFLMNDDRFTRIAKIIETPKGDGLEEDKKNLLKLKSFIKK